MQSSQQMTNMSSIRGVENRPISAPSSSSGAIHGVALTRWTRPTALTRRGCLTDPCGGGSEEVGAAVVCLHLHSRLSHKEMMGQGFRIHDGASRLWRKGKVGRARGLDTAPRMVVGELQGEVAVQVCCCRGLGKTERLTNAPAMCASSDHRHQQAPAIFRDAPKQCHP